MLDLSSLPRGAVASGLEHNLVLLGTLPKVYEHFLGAIHVHFDADAVWLRRTRREGRVVSEDYTKGDPRHQDKKLNQAWSSLPSSVAISGVTARVLGCSSRIHHVASLLSTKLIVSRSGIL